VKIIEKEEEEEQSKQAEAAQNLSQSVENDTNKQAVVSQAKIESSVQNGKQLGELIDREYKFTRKTQKLISEQVSTFELEKLIFEDDIFLQRAAKELSYPSLVFIAKTVSILGLYKRFSVDSAVLKFFIKQLKNPEKSDEEKKKIIRLLLCFNEEAVKDKIVNSQNPTLILILLDLQKEAFDENLFKGKLRVSSENLIFKTTMAMKKKKKKQKNRKVEKPKKQCKDIA